MTTPTTQERALRPTNDLVVKAVHDTCVDLKNAARSLDQLDSEISHLVQERESMDGKSHRARSSLLELLEALGLTSHQAEIALTLLLDYHWYQQPFDVVAEQVEQAVVTASTMEE